jgi:hypothetical protein
MLSTLGESTTDTATIVATGDMLYVQSGYSMFGGMPGNVLIAYQLQKAEK